MMLRPLIKQQVKGLNVQVYDARVRQQVSEGDLYLYFAVIFMYHLTNLSVLATRVLFHEMGCKQNDRVAL